MLHSVPSRWSLLIAANVLLMVVMGCEAKPSNSSAKQPAPAMPVADAPKPAATPAPSVTDAATATRQAIARAASAQNLSRSAQSADDWGLVALRWQQAIDALKQVPASDPQQPQVKKRLADYQRNLAYAQKRVKNPGLGGSDAPPPVAAQTGPSDGFGMISVSGPRPANRQALCIQLERQYEYARINRDSAQSLVSAIERDRASNPMLEQSLYAARTRLQSTEMRLRQAEFNYRQYC